MKNYITGNFIFEKMVPKKAKGSKVWDIKGIEYIDLSSAIAVNSLGHCNPKLIRQLNKQAQLIWHSSNIFTNLPSQQLAQKLVDNTFAKKVFFANSGAESNEAALKLARKYSHDFINKDKNQIISCYNSFHGRTLFTVTVGGQKKYQEGFGPLPKSILHIEYNNQEHLKKYLNDNVCALIIEPIQGEGGVIPAHLEFLKLARRLCTKYKIALIFDEVQTGMGRTGKLFAYEYFQVTPDILTSAKALGCGFPIGAMLVNETLAKGFSAGDHGTTLGGNPLACSVALKAFNLINNKKLLENVKIQSKKIMEFLNKINKINTLFKDIRGIGLLIGCELNEKYENKANFLVKLALKNNLIILQAGNNVIRIAPALNINNADLNLGMQKLEKTFINFISQYK